ncbi:aldehyde dehydrogenase (NADP(+)) [Candidatus Colwellia aromaticivorans]|uniref:aldehyde dehydrogenase (NADP(+)) n=1 Tax=Candidatus Colwellia aromaticivorans TaxID=2267621 RepID=UPI001443E387|nr:aldehyde dehydrogenase (NADP(+)) [Candidatus Colwellia aromaticivorans]
MNLTKKSFINGQWQATQGENFNSHNPVTNQTIEQYPSATVADGASAVSGAKTSFAALKKLSGIQRAVFLEQIAIEIEALGDDLLNTANDETGLGLVRLTGERGRTCNQIRAFATMLKEGSWVKASIDTADAQRTPPKPDLRRMLRPIGPVLVFPASNFPLAFGVLGGDTASALAAGNPVVIKAHPAHPATSELCMIAAERALDKCGIATNTIAMVQGNTLELAQSLVVNEDIQAIGFTGSLKTGRSIMDLAATRAKPIPVYAEMGSTNPVFITPAALAARGNDIANGLAASIAMGTGQFCTSPGVIVTLKNEQFQAQLIDAVNSANQGYLLHPSIAAGLKASVDSLVNNDNVEVLAGTTLAADSLKTPNSLVATSAQAFLTDDTLHAEAFGPISLLVNCQNETELVAVADAIHGNLTATIHCQSDDELAIPLALSLEDHVGRLIVNGYPTGVEVCASQQHSGPYPACSSAATTSVGSDAISRFTRFIAYQDMPQTLLPVELQDNNSLQILRQVNNNYHHDAA